MATSNKAIPMVLIGVAALAVVAYFGMINPPGDEVAGTVVPAERYRTEQPGAADVELGDQTIQEFMQTDAFELILNDEVVRNALSSDAVRDAFASDAVRDAFASDAVRNALASDAVRNALANDAVRSALNNDVFQNALSSSALRNDAQRK